MNIDEKTIEQYLMEHPEIAYRVLSKHELKKSGNRSFKRKVEDPIGEIDSKVIEREAKKEIEKSRRDLLKLAGLGVSAGLLGLLGGRELGIREALAQSQAVQIEPNSFVIPASYVVFGDDLDNDGVLDIIYARNGRTGQIDYKGNDASQIIQNALNGLPDSGGLVVIRDMSFQLNSGDMIIVEGKEFIDLYLFNVRVNGNYTGSRIDFIEVKGDTVKKFRIKGYNTKFYDVGRVVSVASSDVNINDVNMDLFMAEGLEIWVPDEYSGSNRWGGFGFAFYFSGPNYGHIKRIILRDIYSMFVKHSNYPESVLAYFAVGADDIIIDNVSVVNKDQNGYFNTVSSSIYPYVDRIFIINSYMAGLTKLASKSHYIFNCEFEGALDLYPVVQLDDVNNQATFIHDISIVNSVKIHGTIGFWDNEQFTPEGRTTTYTVTNRLETILICNSKIKLPSRGGVAPSSDSITKTQVGVKEIVIDGVVAEPEDNLLNGVLLRLTGGEYDNIVIRNTVVRKNSLGNNPIIALLQTNYGGVDTDILNVANLSLENIHLNSANIRHLWLYGGSPSLYVNLSNTNTFGLEASRIVIDGNTSSVSISYNGFRNSGVATFSGDGVSTQFTIAHGLVSTPSSVRVTPGSVDASGQFYITVDNTNIYVNYLSAPPSGTNNITLYWEAEV